MQHREMNRTGALGRHDQAVLCRMPESVLQSDEVVPVVLEFVQPPVAVYVRQNPQANAAAYEAGLEETHKQFLAQMATLGLDVQLGKSRSLIAGPDGDSILDLPHDFTHVFNGLGVLMPGKAVQKVSVMGGIRTITLNEERVYLSLAESVPFLGAPKVWDQVDAAGRRIRGEGVTVAVIDTGIDWNHPEFGGYATVPNEKVTHAISLTSEGPKDSFGHGTHVSCIIAGDADYKATPRGDARYNGVAPKAKLMGYKVLTASGTGSATNIILAMEDAVKRGAQVMNLSLGDSLGDPSSPESSAANNAMLAGVIVCLAAGNSGPEPYTIGAPGAAHHVLTVGASTDDGVTELVAQLVQPSGEMRSVGMRLMESSTLLPSPALELGYVLCGMGQAASDFPAQVKGNVALVERGEVTFREKAVAAQAAGAAACVIYNNQTGNFYGSLGDEKPVPTIPTVSISMEDGQMMKQALAGAPGLSEAKLRLNPEEIPQPNRMAEFSSRGPNKDGWIKPELTAPGVNITSATVTEAGIPGGGMPDPSGYISASGTSMATPHVAGIAALMRQAHPDWTAVQIKAALVNTAQFMAGQGGVMDQGNGAISLARAIAGRAILVTATDPPSPTYSFGTVVNGAKEHRSTLPLTIVPLSTSTQSTPVDYKISAVLNGEVEGLKAEVSPMTTPSGPGRDAGFELVVTADGSKLADGAYYGWVVVEADWGTLRLPFWYEAARQPQSTPPTPEHRESLAAQPVRPVPGAIPWR
ncbi:MAG: S8 family serine peptidase [Mycobacterium leprae]